MLRIWTEHGFDVFFLWRWILAVSGGVYTLLGTMAESPFLVGLGALAFSLLSAVALWVLYRNLVATPTVENSYARARV